MTIYGMYSGPLEEPSLNCTPPSINEFPGDFFTNDQRKQGGVVVHFLIAFYIFGAMSIICHDYFVASIERICDALNLEADVAGGTFMAAGGSASELFTAVIGVFISQSDVGIGTIVGSAVFNLLFIVGLCGIFAGMAIHVTWWSMYRDLSAYILSVITLTVVIWDSQVTWYESLIMVALYFGYLCLMFNNRHVGGFVKRLVSMCQNRTRKKRLYQAPPPDSAVLTTDEKTPLLFGRSSSNSVKIDGQSPRTSLLPTRDDIEDGMANGNAVQPHANSSSNEIETSFGGTPKTNSAPATEFVSPWTVPENILSRIFWAVMLPFSFCCFITIPDCRRPGIWRRLYMLTFFASVVWIAGLSYFMVWMVTIIGDTIGIPEFVMGLTLLAYGGSLPDVFCCLYATKAGFGDMAVANSVGSNVFDILFCLGLPWLLKTSFVEPNGIVEISSKGIEITLLTLIFSALFILVSLHLTKWLLGKRLGIICVVLYVVLIVFSCLFQGNVFGQVTLPTCELL